jgi:hypothetical protein
MATCPAGHESASDDFCDVCGYVIGAPASLAPDRTPAEECPRCGTPRAGQFCEACGFDFTAGGRQAPPATRIESRPEPRQAESWPFESGPAESGPARPAPGRPGAPDVAAWTAVVSADRAYYDSVQATGGPDAGSVAFPVYCPERRFRLTGPEARVGRRSARTGIDPEIDLTGPPADPGVSRLHVVLIRAADGSWSVLDPGSANGTLVNGTEIARDRIVPLRDGDRIHLGAWTELTIVRDG